MFCHEDENLAKNRQLSHIAEKSETKKRVNLTKICPNVSKISCNEKENMIK